MKKLLLFLFTMSASGALLFGQTWTQVSPGSMGTSTGLTTHNGALFSSTTAFSPHRSSDGTNWVQKANGLTGFGPQGGGIGTCGSYIYYGSKSDIHRSNDDGNTWTTANSGITVSANNYGRYFYQFNGVYYVSMNAAVTNGGGLWRSTDGTTWTAVSLAGGPGETAYTMAEIGGKLYVCTNFDFYESSDNGLSWNAVATNGTKMYNGLFEHLGRRLIHTTFGMEYSDDNGASWNSLTTSITSSTYCGFIAGANDTLYTWSASSGIYYSVDTGNTWVNITGDLTSNDVLFMQGVQYFSGNLYVGTLSYVKSNGTGGSTSVSEIDKPGLVDIYPNPFTNTLKVNNRHGVMVEVNLIDITGKVVSSEVISNTHINLNTIQLPQGMYFLNVIDFKTGKIITTEKVIKQ